MVDKEGDRIESALKDFIEFIGDLRLVTYNADFDMGFLRSSLDPARVQPGRK